MVATMRDCGFVVDTPQPGSLSLSLDLCLCVRVREKMPHTIQRHNEMKNSSWTMTVVLFASRDSFGGVFHLCRVPLAVLLR